MNITSVSIVDNTDLVKKATDEAIERALEAVGLQAEGYAKMLCPVDTGLLRNSITHAVSGHGVSSSSYHASYGSNKHKSGKNKGKRYSATAKNAGSVGVGRYSGGTVGAEGDIAVYIGTNVEYAPYVEMGTQRMKAQPFIKPAVENHVDEYKRIFETYLKG